MAGSVEELKAQVAGLRKQVRELSRANVRTTVWFGPGGGFNRSLLHGLLLQCGSSRFSGVGGR